MRHAHVQPAAVFREPSARNDAAADQVGGLSGVVFLPLRRPDDQGHLRGEVEINHVTVPHAAQHGPFDETESGVSGRQPASRHGRVSGLGPDAALGGARLLFGGQVERNLSDVRRDRHRPGEPFAQHDLFGVAPVRQQHVGQQAPVVIVVFALEDQRHATVFYERGQARARRRGHRLIRRAVLAELGRVDADQPHVLSIGEDHRVTVNDVTYLGGPVGGAGCRRKQR